MHARVVRFTDVDRDRIDNIIRTVSESDGPPPGVESSGLRLFYDADQGTAVFVGFFDDAEKMAAADAIFDQMDAGETPGTRASIDRCEMVLERDM